MDKKSHDGDYQCHDKRERVEGERDRLCISRELHPCPECLGECMSLGWIAQELDRHDNREQGRHSYRPHADIGDDLFRKTPAKQCQDKETGQRDRGYEEK